MQPVFGAHRRRQVQAEFMLTIASKTAAGDRRAMASLAAGGRIAYSVIQITQRRQFPVYIVW
jgi:hypothetical protein